MSVASPSSRPPKLRGDFAGMAEALAEFAKSEFPQGQATQLRTANAQRAEELQRLEQKVVSGSTPAEVARAAVAAGRVPAGVAAHLVIAPDGSSVLRGTPEPAPAPGQVAGGN